MTTVQKLVFAIMRFLDHQSESGGHQNDVRESIEVAHQCLASAFDVNPEDRARLETTPDLLTLFANCVGETAHPEASRQAADGDTKAKAEQLKNQGNEFVKQNDHLQAIKCYTEAISLDPNNAIYYSNRAAAYNKLEKYAEAIADCNAAIAIDPSYSKAYSRKGLALSALGNHQEAVIYYKKALQLEPDNQSYRSNLQVAEDQLKQTTGVGGAGAGAGGFDFMALLNNPSLRSMAATLMSNPAMQQAMNSMVSGTAAGSAEGSGGGFDQLLRVGQQMAQQLQQSNPELIEQLREQMQGTGGGLGAADQSPPQPPAP